MKYVSIDLETTGLDPEWCQVLEFGAVIEDTANPEPLAQLPTFRRYVRHSKIVGHPFALAMNAEILRAIAAAPADDPQFVIVGQCIEQFTEWLTLHGVDSKHILAAGKNFGAFDLQFIHNMDWRDDLGFLHRSLDPVTLYTLPTDEKPPSMKECLQRAGIDAEVSHTTVEDALQVVQLFRKAWDINEPDHLCQSPLANVA